MEPKVSIIIPIYNAAPYIRRCLRSIECQTYDNVECLLIDDCGTDNSMQIAEQFISNYKGKILFQIIRHEQNLGLSAARNSGIYAASGEYIFFIDSDDAVTSDCLEELTNLAKKYPNVDFVQGNTIKDLDNLMEGQNDIDVPEFCNDKLILEKIILTKTNRTAWNRIIKRSFLIDNSILFPVGLIMEDHYWLYFISKYCNAASFTNKGTYLYYRNENSIVNSMSKSFLIKRYSSYITISNTIINDLIHRSDIQTYHKMYVGEALVFCMINLCRLHSIIHWSRFWYYALCLLFKIGKRITWRQVLLFICMMPPLCFMVKISGWRWRLREYIVAKL